MRLENEDGWGRLVVDAKGNVGAATIAVQFRSVVRKVTFPHRAVVAKR